MYIFAPRTLLHKYVTPHHLAPKGFVARPVKHHTRVAKVLVLSSILTCTNILRSFLLKKKRHLMKTYA